jgi:hypothetical protein
MRIQLVSSVKSIKKKIDLVLTVEKKTDRREVGVQIPGT